MEPPMSPTRWPNGSPPGPRSRGVRRQLRLDERSVRIREPEIHQEAAEPCLSASSSPGGMARLRAPLWKRQRCSRVTT